MAFPSIRQAQLRWTSKLSSNAFWSVAVEDNKSSIPSPTEEPGKAEYPMPDLTTNVRFGGDARARLRLRFSRQGPIQSCRRTERRRHALGQHAVDGWCKTFGKDYAYAQFTFGDGVGRYRGGVTAVPDFNGDLKAVGLYAFIRL